MTELEEQIPSYARVLDRAAADHVPPVALEPRARSRRRPVPIAVVAAARVVIVGAIVSVVVDFGGGPDHRIGIVSTPESQWQTVTDATHGLSLSYPPSWQAAPSTLTPV